MVNNILWVTAAAFVAVGVLPLIFKRIFNEGSAATIIFGAVAALCAVLRALGDKIGAFTTISHLFLFLLIAAFLGGLAVSAAMLLVIIKSEASLKRLQKAKDLGAVSLPQCDFVIILGCRLFTDEPTRALLGRVDRGLEILLADTAAVAVVSGGQGSDEQISEALAMENYLKSKGQIPVNRIIREDKSTTTEENLRFSLPLIDEFCRQRDFSRGKIIIVSDGFHLLRAKLLARKQGISNVMFAPSRRIAVDFPVHWVREILGIARFILLGR